MKQQQQRQPQGVIVWCVCIKLSWTILNYDRKKVDYVNFLLVNQV